jgi:alanine or glycine:cation symporter, AGCS family
MAMLIVKYINSFLWDKFLIFFLASTGIYFTFKLKFVQVRYFWRSILNVFTKRAQQESEDGTEGMSAFQSLSTAVAAQIGTGNLAGAATAIVSGGPGAIFWMWVCSFFGMSTAFAEAVLGQKYRQNIEGEYAGGPAYYIKHGLKMPILAGITSIALIITMGFICPMIQSNSLALSFSTAFNIPVYVIALVSALLVGFVLCGGMARIARVTEMIVPFMALGYFIGGMIIILINYQNIIPAFEMIFVGAFNPQAIMGGALGVTVRQAVRYGVARGLFSNEAGLGSTPHAHAVAKVKHPADQGFVAFFGVFVDTFIVLTITALVILTSGVYGNGQTGIELTQSAFLAGLGGFGSVFIAIALFFFVFSTIIGWAFFAEENIKFLLVKKFGHKSIYVFRALVLVCVVVGAYMKVDLMWEMADTFYGLIAIPNLFALLMLSKVIKKELSDYDEKYGKD